MTVVTDSTTIAVHVDAAPAARYLGTDLTRDMTPTPIAATGLHVTRRTASGEPLASVVCIHGALDSARSFGRLARRLDDLQVVAYDRRGYRASRGVTLAAGLAVQVDDALEVVASVGSAPPVVMLGHSFGGLVALAAAARQPSPPIAAIVVYEPPFPWLRELPGDYHAPLGDDAAAEAEAFFSRIVGPASWDRLSEPERESRRLDGPALVEDLRVLRGPLPFELGDVAVPVVVGIGEDASSRRRDASATLAAAIPDATLVTVPRAGHGAHLSHPDRLAVLVYDAVRRAIT